MRKEWTLFDRYCTGYISSRQKVDQINHISCSEFILSEEVKKGINSIEIGFHYPKKSQSLEAAYSVTKKACRLFDIDLTVRTSIR